MFRVTVNNKTFVLTEKMLLSHFLSDNGIIVSHPCAGKGTCRKCTVKVNGRDVLSCQHMLSEDSYIELTPENIVSDTGISEIEGQHSAEKLVLDLGTTTLSLAAMNSDGEAFSVISRTNPQRAFGADIISRIEYSKNGGVKKLQDVLIREINNMISCISPEGTATTLFVAGNTAMLHFFTGEDASSLGVYPYTPVFLGAKDFSAEDMGICGVKNVSLLPSQDAFIGADITAGMNYIGFPEKNKYYLLVDLGTNAEIVLFSKDRALCTAAAAGPCFEGASISCGMSAVDGAIFSYSENSIKTIGGKKPEGICGTGLFDIISYMLNKGVIDESGYMSEERFCICDSVYISREDIRQFQTAKSAIHSAICVLIKKAGITFRDISRLYISGGFSASINRISAVSTGLFPKELLPKCEAVRNSCLLGTVKYASQSNDLTAFTEISEYIDLSADKDFGELFISSMMFMTEEE